MPPTVVLPAGSGSAALRAQLRPASARMHAQRHTGELGVDPMLSRFLDANHYNDHIVDPTKDLLMCIRAKAKYTVADKGTFREEMRPCRILDYDADTNTYGIEWTDAAGKPLFTDLAAPKRKRVKPLAVQYGNETSGMYEQRVERAKTRRDADEGTLRYHTYVAKHSEVEVLPWPEESVERVLLLATGGEVPRHQAPTAQSILAELEDVWSTGLRSEVIARSLRSQLAEAAASTEKRDDTPAELLMLAVPAAHVDAPADSPLIAVTPLDSHTGQRVPRHLDFARCQTYLAKECFTVRPELYRTLAFAVSRWNLFRTRWIVDSQVSSTLPVPVELHTFAQHQAKYTSRVHDALHIEWMTSILDTLHAELATTFKFFEDKQENFLQSRARRFFKTLNFILAGQIQALVDGTLDRFGDWLASQTLDDEWLRALDSPEPRVELMIRVGCRAGDAVVPYRVREPTGDGAEDDLADGGDALVRQGSIVADATMGRAISGTVSVVAIRLIVNEDEGTMVFDPPLDLACDAVRRMYSCIFDTTDDLMELGSQFFPMMDLPPVPLTTRAQELRDTNPHVLRVRELLEEVLVHNARAAEAVKDLYRPFEFLVQQTVDEMVTTFIDAPGEPTLQDYARVCDHLQHLERVLEERSLNEVVVPLFRLNTVGAKTQLRTRLHELVAAHLAHLIHKTTLQIDDIDERYLAVFNRMQEVPQTPEELRDLRLYLDQLPQVMSELESALDRVAERIQLLGRYGHMPRQATFERYWSAYSWPRKIGVIADDLPFHLQSYRAQFLGQLREETEAMQRRIQDVTRRVNMLSFEEDENLVEQNSAVVESIERELEEVRQLTAMYNRHEAIFQQAQTRWAGLKELQVQFEPHLLLWRTVADCRKTDVWVDTKLESIDSELIAQQHQTWSRDITRLSKVLAMEAPIAVVRAVKVRLDAFRPVIPIAVALAKPSVMNRRRHMVRLAEILGVERFELREKTLNDLDGDAVR
jgi:hypothetical protein